MFYFDIGNMFFFFAKDLEMLYRYTELWLNKMDKNWQNWDLRNI